MIAFSRINFAPYQALFDFVRSLARCAVAPITLSACALIDDDLDDLDELAQYSFSDSLEARMSALGCATDPSGDLGACFTRYDQSSDDSRIFNLIEYLHFSTLMP